MYFDKIVYIFIGFISMTNSNAISKSNFENANSANVLRDEDNLIIMDTKEHDSLIAATSSSDSSMSIEDQVRLLSKQMNALMMRRREDFKMLENSLKKSVRKNSLQFGDTDLREELNQLRQEVKSLRKGKQDNKERLTVDWLSQSITELRSELAEIQEASSNTSRSLQQRNIVFEEVSEMKREFNKINLELEALRIRQETTERIVKELKSEAIQSNEDFRKSIKHHEKESSASTIDFIEPEADHRMRHQRFMRQQLHDMDMSQKNMKLQLSELQHHRIGDRLRSLEIEQRRLANANFNLSRQVASLDRLHGSMLELLEDIESIQNKVDKTIPDIKREISKVEFNSAQLTSEQILLREEGHNAAKSIQAMAVSVSTLQEEREESKQLQKNVEKLQQDIEQLKATSNTHRDIVHRRIEKIESDSKSNSTSSHQPSSQTFSELQIATDLVKQLESVELQYESIVNKLPNDCSQVEQQQNTNGLYLIAPIGQHNPIMSHCSAGGWTTIQRRYDGSVDFNRSWNEYAQGFGQPSGEYWIGNDVLHHLSSDNCSSLKIIMQDIYDNTWEAVYNEFNVASRDMGYRLTISGYKGNASDAFDYQNHMQFSAIDVDKDISNTHCAGNYEGGWWFSHCQHANLNGRYNLGLTWFDASRNEWIAVKSSHMMVSRRNDCSIPHTISSSTITPSSSSYSSTTIPNVSKRSSSSSSSSTASTTITNI